MIALDNLLIGLIKNNFKLIFNYLALVTQTTENVVVFY